MNNVKYEDWINASKEKLEELERKYDMIYLVGHSMGGVIATYLASKYRIVKKLVLLAPAFMYVNIKQIKDDLKEKIYDKKAKIEYPETATYKEIMSKVLSVSPLCLLEFTKLIKKYHDCPKEVTCPVLIIHGNKDGIVPIKSSRYVYDTIGSKSKYMILVKNVKHRILISAKKKIVSKYINNYLKGGLLWIITRKSEI
jgi:esterase/lipase